MLEILEKECVSELIGGVVVETLRKARNELVAKRMIENQKVKEDATACNDIVMD